MKLPILSALLLATTLLFIGCKKDKTHSDECDIDHSQLVSETAIDYKTVYEYDNSNRLLTATVHDLSGSILNVSNYTYPDAYTIKVETNLPSVSTIRYIHLDSLGNTTSVETYTADSNMYGKMTYYYTPDRRCSMFTIFQNWPNDTSAGPPHFYTDTVILNWQGGNIISQDYVLYESYNMNTNQRIANRCHEDFDYYPNTSGRQFTVPVAAHYNTASFGFEGLPGLLLHPNMIFPVNFLKSGIQTSGNGISDNYQYIPSFDGQKKLTQLKVVDAINHSTSISTYQYKCK